jgi:hypothetical protein
LNYLKEIHRKIDDNNFQSTTVERAYKFLTKDTLHKKILQNFIKQKVSDKYFLKFAKIIT